MPYDPAVRAMRNYQQKHILGFSGFVDKNAFYGITCESRNSKLPRGPPTAEWIGHEDEYTQRTPRRKENIHPRDWISQAGRALRKPKKGGSESRSVVSNSL